MQVVALYQSGLLDTMPEPDLPLLDADKVDALEEAYQFLSVGDGFLGLISYGVTALFAASGSTDRYRQTPWIRWRWREKLSSPRFRQDVSPEISGRNTGHSAHGASSLPGRHSRPSP